MAAVIIGGQTRFGDFGRALGFLSRPTALRTLLILGSVVAVLGAAALDQPDAYLKTDPELAFLLRGMALIKAGIASAALAVLLWRFGRWVPPWTAAAYLAGAWLLAGGSMLVWQLTFIPAAAVCFHIGELGILVLAWRDYHSEPVAPAL